MTNYAALTEAEFMAKFDKIENEYIAANARLREVEREYAAAPREFRAMRYAAEAAANKAINAYDEAVAEYERRFGV